MGGGSGSGGGSSGRVPASGEKAADATRSLDSCRSATVFPSGRVRHESSPFQAPMTSIRPSGEKRVAPTGADISFTQSLSYGAHWQHMRFVSVNGDGTPAAEDQFLPWMAVDENGTTHVIWLDNRNDPNNVMVETFKEVTNDLNDFTGNVDISTVAWDPNAGFFSSGAFIGDYSGLAAGVNNNVVLEYPMWTDGRNTLPSPHGQTDVFTVPNE